jgi:hypothetical protein
VSEPNTERKKRKKEKKENENFALKLTNVTKKQNIMFIPCKNNTPTPNLHHTKVYNSQPFTQQFSP